jgi:hypothetical protein
MNIANIINIKSNKFCSKSFGSNKFNLGSILASKYLSIFNISELKKINGIDFKKTKILKIVSKITTKVGVFIYIYIIAINKKFCVQILYTI